MPKIEKLSASQRIHGVLAPVVTPFKADLAPDRERFVKHCQWLISQDCGLAPFGTTSEANSMSKDERISLLDTLLAAGIDPSRMMPGVGCCSIDETVELTSHAMRHDCAGVLMLPPFYYKDVSEEGLYRYCSEVVQRVGDARLRIYLYHIPPVAVVGITPKLVERLLKAYPSAIAGMKDSSGDWNNTKTFLDAFSVRTRHETSSKSQTSSSKSQGSSKIQYSKGEKTFGARRGGDFDNQTSFDVFVGSESFLLANMCDGGAGTISAMANVNPAAIYDLYQKCSGVCDKRRVNTKSLGTSASTTDLDAQQAQLNVVREVFSSKKFPSMIAAMKQAIAIYSNDPDWARVRPPLVELTAEQAKLLAEELNRIGFAMNGLGKAES